MTGRLERPKDGDGPPLSKKEKARLFNQQFGREISPKNRGPRDGNKLKASFKKKHLG